jgi:hypothetical protein
MFKYTAECKQCLCNKLQNLDFCNKRTCVSFCRNSIAFSLKQPFFLCGYLLYVQYLCHLFTDAKVLRYIYKSYLMMCQSLVYFCGVALRLEVTSKFDRTVFSIQNSYFLGIQILNICMLKLFL